jgi:hypothetical protein
LRGWANSSLSLHRFTEARAVAMTLTVRTLRNAVDAGFRKLSGAPLKLRRAKLLAER